MSGSGSLLGAAPLWTPAQQVPVTLLLRAAGSLFAGAALLLVLKRKLLEVRCCPRSSRSGSHVPWVSYNKRVSTHGPQRPAGFTRAPGRGCVLEGVTPLHSSSQKLPRQLASVRRTAPSRLCSEEVSSGSNVVFAGGHLKETPVKAQCSCKAWSKLSHQQSQSQKLMTANNPQLAHNLPSPP